MKHFIFHHEPGNLFIFDTGSENPIDNHFTLLREMRGDMDTLTHRERGEYLSRHPNYTGEKWTPGHPLKTTLFSPYQRTQRNPWKF